MHLHAHHDSKTASQLGEKRLWWAVGANCFLTLVQVIGGVVSGSLALIADALHNFSDAASLLLALIAIRIGRRPPDQFKTFGYKRAETIAALINLVVLVIIGLGLVIEAFKRFYAPIDVDGGLVIIVAVVALAVDVFTSYLTYSQSKSSMNMHAVFLHNLTDALGSLGVIIGAVLILNYGWMRVDALITLMIATYILWQGFLEMPRVIHLLMEGTPEGIEIDEVIEGMQGRDGVANVHHVHIWQLDEHRNALEAHVVLTQTGDMDTVKKDLKSYLVEKFDITHSTLEFENVSCETK